MNINIERLMKDKHTEATEFESIDGAIANSEEVIIYCFGFGLDLVLTVSNDPITSRGVGGRMTVNGSIYSEQVVDVLNNVKIEDVYVQQADNIDTIENKEEVIKYLENYL